MGEASRAREARLERDVAIKVLPAAADNDIHYVVSELLEGETLRSILERGPVSPRNRLK